MDQKTKVLVESILKWWDKNQHNMIDSCRGFDYKEYDNPPDFVKIAEAMKYADDLKL